MSSEDSSALLGDVEELAREAERRIGDGDRKGGRRTFERALAVAREAANARSYLAPFIHAEALATVASAQARTGETRTAQATFRKARSAATGAPPSITHLSQRKEQADEIAAQEVAAHLEAGVFRAAGAAAQRVADDERGLKSWTMIGAAQAIAGDAKAAAGSFAKARKRASRISDQVMREHWLGMIGEREAESHTAAPPPPGEARPRGDRPSALRDIARLGKGVREGDPGDLEALLRTLEHRDHDVCRAAIAAIAELCYQKDLETGALVDAVIAALGHRDAAVRRKAAGTIESLSFLHSAGSGRLGRDGAEAALPRLIEASADDDPEVGAHAATALGHIRETRAAAPLARVLARRPLLRGLVGGRGGAARRKAAAEALGNIGDASAVDALIKAMWKDPAPEVRNEAVQALAKIGDPRALPDLARAIGDRVIGHEAAGAVLEFRDRGLVTPEQMAWLRHGSPDDAFPRK